MSYQYPSLFKRLLAIIYDLLLLFGILFFAVLVALLAFGESIANNPLFSLYLLGATFFFYGWFWTHGGQTLGMKAWKIRVCLPDGGQINWARALLRFAGACLSWLLLGAGYLWALFDSRNQTLHDHLSGTQLVSTEKDRKTG